MHHQLPILSNQTNEDAHCCRKKVIEILSWRVAIWFALINNLIEPVNLGLVLEQLYSEQTKDEDNDQKEKEESDDIFQGFTNLDNHFVESLPFTEESENSEQSEPSEYG